MKKALIVLMLLVSIVQATSPKANITAVTAKGSNNSYSFSVTIKSDETGCEQYADWWEILSEEGNLLYRRILVHSHPKTQPFTRSSKQLSIKEDETLYIRAHLNNLDYVGDVFKGSVQSGFEKVEEFPTFDAKIEIQAPLPNGCLF